MDQQHTFKKSFEDGHVDFQRAVVIEHSDQLPVVHALPEGAPVLLQILASQGLFNRPS